jgi:uncharacterized protein YukE
MTDLKVTAEFVRALAKIQTDAADEIGNATDMVNGVSERVSTTHGWICSATSTALKSAQDERQRAGNSCQSGSKDLAVKLDHAAAKYDETDAAGQAQLNAQMHPGR